MAATATARKLEPYYIYADYARWPADERWELIDGVAYAMASPSRLHQEILFEMARQVGNYLQGKPCRGYVAPFDVRLPKRNEADDQVDTVVQPDLSVICDPNKLDAKGCRGAPDWVVEVLSPSTTLKDMNIKVTLYEQHQVREYWIVHPQERWVMVYLLDARGQYGKPSVYGMDEPTATHIFPDCAIDWSNLPPPEEPA